jgi:mannose-6-phosphate isomerase-like protein (cupin superfamily)
MNAGEIVHPNVGETLTCVRSARDGGAFVYDLVLAAGFRDSPPMHAHRDDEVVEITEGAIAFVADGHRREVRAGERLVIPAGTMHTFTNASKSETVRGRAENGLAFERLVDQFAGGGPSFTRLAQQVIADPAGYRTRLAVHLALRLVAFVGRLRGIRPHAAT